MGMLDRLKSWWRGNNEPAAKQPPAATAGTETKANRAAVGSSVRGALAGAISGSWASDHREEANHFTHFNYVTIHAIAQQIASATITVYDDGENQHSNSSVRKSIRAKTGSYVRWSSTRKSYLSENDGKPLSTLHPFVKLLSCPNPYETGASFRYRIAQQLRITGTALIWNVPSIEGTICQRYVIPTGAATPMMPTADMPLGSFRIQPTCSRYVTVEDQGYMVGSPVLRTLIGATVDARQIQKIQYPHPFYLDDGQSPLSAAAQWIDLETAVNVSRTSTTKNGIDGSIYYDLGEESNVDEDELERVRAKLHKNYGGPNNAGAVIVGQGGAQVTSLSTTPKDMAYTDGFQDVKNSILALHQTPPVAVGFQDAGAFAAYNASMKSWRISAIQPICDMIAESDTMFLAPKFGVGLTVDIESPDVNDEDFKLKEDALMIQAKNAVRVDEWRARMDLPPLGGEEGRKFVGAPDPAEQMMPGMQPGQTPFAVANKPESPLLKTENDLAEKPVDPKTPESPFTRMKSLQAVMDGGDEEDLRLLMTRLKSMMADETSKAANTPELKPLNGGRAEKNQEYGAKLGCVMLSMPSDVAIKATALGKSIDQADFAPDGLEDSPHVTALYGLTTPFADDVREVVQGFGNVPLLFGKTAVFKADESKPTADGVYDVLYVEVKSERIKALHEKIKSNLDTLLTFPTFIPHMTIAYLKPGAGEKYAGRDDLVGMVASIDWVDFSNCYGEHSPISMKRGDSIESVPDFNAVDGGIPTLKTYRLQLPLNGSRFKSVLSGAPSCPNCGSDETWLIPNSSRCVCEPCQHVFENNQTAMKTAVGMAAAIGSDGGFAVAHRNGSNGSNGSTMKAATKEKTGGRWITIHPHGHGDGDGVPIQIDGDGNILKGPKHLADKGIRHIGDFGKKKPDSDSGEHSDESEEWGGPSDDAIAEMKPHAHQFLVEQHESREKAKEQARRLTGLTAGTIARHENGYRDHSSIRGFDTAARNVAMENPELGLDPDAHETPAKVWELIREGYKKKPSINSREVADLAETWASGTKPRWAAPEVSYAHDSDWDNFKSLYAAGLLRSELKSWDEGKHPRGNQNNAGQFSSSPGGSSGGSTGSTSKPADWRRGMADEIASKVDTVVAATGKDRGDVLRDLNNQGSMDHAGRMSALEKMVDAAKNHKTPEAPKPGDKKRKLPATPVSSAAAKELDESPEYDDVRKAVKAILGDEWKPSHAAALTGAEPNATVSMDGFGHAINIHIWGKDGAYSMTRTLKKRLDGSDTVFMENDFFKTIDNRKGLGAKLFADQVDRCREAGIERIETVAARGSGEYVGYKVWPKLGYDGKLSDSALSELPQEFRTAKTIQELYRMPGGVDAWDKFGQSIHLTFDLRDGSQSMDRLNKYKAAKAGRSTAKAMEGLADGITDNPLSVDDERILDDLIAASIEHESQLKSGTFDESKPPRGNSENAGQFASAPGGGKDTESSVGGESRSGHDQSDSEPDKADGAKPSIAPELLNQDREPEKAYFRVHWDGSDEFSPDNAYSRPWGSENMEEGEEYEPQRGYSSFDNPGKLIQYFEDRGGVPDDATVVVFDGEWMGQGDDGEDLTVPSQVIRTMTWKEFADQYNQDDASLEDIVSREGERQGLDGDTIDAIRDEAINNVGQVINNLSEWVSERAKYWNEPADDEPETPNPSPPVHESEHAEAAKDWKENGTDSKAFKAWFGDSKVVDADGQPKKMFHGTSFDFGSFDTGNKKNGAVLGYGAYFTDDPDRAAAYAGKGDGANTIPVYLSAKNPFDVNGQLTQDQADKIGDSLAKFSDEKSLLTSPRVDKTWPKDQRDEAKKFYEEKLSEWKEIGGNVDRVKPKVESINGEFVVTYSDSSKQSVPRNAALAFQNIMSLHGPDSSSILRDAGFDAVTRGDEWVIFDPKQIKSATGNRGTFDPNHESIKKSATPEVKYYGGKNRGKKR